MKIKDDKSLVAAAFRKGLNGEILSITLDTTSNEFEAWKRGLHTRDAQVTSVKAKALFEAYYSGYLGMLMPNGLGLTTSERKEWRRGLNQAKKDRERAIRRTRRRLNHYDPEPTHSGNNSLSSQGS